VPIDNYLGFLDTGGQAVTADGDVFAYTSRTADGLTGVTGITSEHYAGTQVYPYVQVAAGDYAAQTGYPMSTIGWRRRRMPTVGAWQLYWSYLANVRMYQDPGWRTDYDSTAIVQAGNTNLTCKATLYDALNAVPYRYVRTILLVLDEMTDRGRAKLNELTATVAQLQDLSGDTAAHNLRDGDRSSALAKYLLMNFFGLATGDWAVTAVDTCHQLGVYALAIAPLLHVLGDIAKQTGCLLRLAPTGAVTWEDDPRWPLTNSVPYYTLGTADIRGNVQVQDDLLDADYIILNATTVADNGGIEMARVVWPNPSSPNNPYETEPPARFQGEELDGYICRRGDERLLAEAEYQARKYRGVAQVTLTGLSTWAKPGLDVYLYWDYDGDGQEARRYMIEQVRCTRGGDLGHRTCAYRLQLSRRAL
jgi:hypothetical protein